MVSDLEQGFRLGPWQIEPLRGAVSGPEGESVHLEPKVMEVLVMLAETPHQLVLRQRLLDGIWRGHVAADQLLTRAISELRRALHDRRDRPTFIETVPKRGYRLIAAITPIDRSEPQDVDTPPGAAAGRSRYGLVAALVFVLALGLAWLAYMGLSIARSPVADRPGNDHMVAPFHDTATSIAVLPFANLSDDPGNEYFSDGVSEEIRNLLAEIPNLKVIGRTSSFAFKGKNESLQVIGRQLGVGTVLEGSVRTSGDRVRITARLIDTSDGSRLWSKSYDREMTDIFTLQDDVAAAIIAALQVHIGASPTRGRPTELPEAYALFLKAMPALNDRDVRTAEAALRQAIQLDPEFAEAYELLAHLYWTDYMPEIEPAEVQRLVRENAGKALSMNRDLDFARALYIESDPDNYSAFEAIEALGKAARRRPNSPAILRTLSWELMIGGYLSEALSVAERFVELDPLSSMAHVRHAAVLDAIGREDDAIAALALAEALNSDGLQWVVGESHLFDGRDEMAIEYFESSGGFQADADGGWIRELVTGARNPTTGQAYLDDRIPVVLRTVPLPERESARFALNTLYLLFGYLDRYFEIILDSDLDGGAAVPAEYYVGWGTVYRQGGFTSHSRYAEVAELMGFTDVWERRGPPDFCEKTHGKWRCN